MSMDDAVDDVNRFDISGGVRKFSEAMPPREPTTRVRPVEEGFSTLNDRLDHLDKVLTELQDRIGPVVAPEMTSSMPDSPTDESHTDSSVIVRDLDTLQRRVRGMTNRMADTLERIEL